MTLGNGGSGNRGALVDRLALIWLASVSVAATTYLGANDVLSSDAVSGLLGSVVALAGGFSIRDQFARRESRLREQANGHTEGADASHTG